MGLGDLLGRMPAGFQQMIGEGGWQLSHGERSRLFVARALLQGRFVAGIDDIHDVAIPVLAHRVIVNFQASSEGITSNDVVTELLGLQKHGAAAA